MLVPTFRLDLSVAAQIRSSEREFAKPTDRQAMILHNLCRKSRVIVHGNAGSGKTLLALETARHFARQGMRTLLTCFNRPLAATLAERANGTPNLVVLNYHALCAEFAKQVGRPMSPLPENADKAARDHYWDVTHTDALLDAIELEPELRFDAIIVDEGQDFRESWWTALQMALVDPEDGILQIFHDPHQAIYISGTSLPTIADQFALPQVLRNTRQIYEVGIRRFGIEALCLGPDGADVRWVSCKPEEVIRELKRILHQLVHDEQIAPNEIAILTGHRPERSGIGKENMIGPHQVCVGIDDGRRVFVTTIHSFKGLERACVILCDLDDAVERGDEELLYVGMTRARSHLIVLAAPETISRLRAPSEMPRRAS
jgi:superfamily I DNA and RNA helicase